MRFVGSCVGSFMNPHEQHRKSGGQQDALRYTAVDPTADATITMGGHHDLLDVRLLSIVENRLGRWPTANDRGCVQAELSDSVGYF